MSGDMLHIKVDYYIPSATTDNTTANGLNSIITTLTNVINTDPVTAPLHGSGSTITTSLNNSTPFTNFISPENGTAGTTLPKAYLNIVFFDEQFKFVSQNSEVIQVAIEGSGQTIYRLNGTAKAATKNGFVYIYVSNESNNLVYFDNLQITHEHGPLLQEDHYYPYGLGMAGISSSAISGIVANAYKANGGSELGSGEWADGKGLELYETTYRSYDAQIGRFMQVDPLLENSANFSGYVFVGDNPVHAIDPTGLKLIYMDPEPPSHGAGDNPDNIWDDGGGGGGRGYYSHKDSNGNMWHHTDVLAGTASAAQQYVAGYGWDGFGGTGDGSIDGGNIVDPSRYFSKIKEIIAKGYTIAVADVVVSNHGNLYGTIGFYDPTDKLGGSNDLNMLLQQNTSYTQQGLNGGEGNGWETAKGATELTDMGLGYVDYLQVESRSAQMITGGSELKMISETAGKAAGVGLAITSGIFTAIDAEKQYGHLRNSDKADLLIDGVQAGLAFFEVSSPIGWAFGVGMFVGNLVSEHYTGKSITENLFANDNN